MQDLITRTLNQWDSNRIASYRAHYPHDRNLMEAIDTIETLTSLLTTEVRVRTFHITNTDPVLRELYRNLRKTGLSRHNANMVCIGAIMTDFSLGDINVSAV